MGWKMKKIMSLGVVLALIYCQQSGNAQASEEQDRKCFEAECPNPDGKSGYYVTRPEVKIKRIWSDTVSFCKWGRTGGGRRTKRIGRTGGYRNRADGRR